MASTEDPKVEEVDTNKEAEGDNEMPELENQPGEERKFTKAEKKARKALAKIGLKSLSGITRVTLKRRDGIVFVIANPDVQQSTTNENSFVILGELKMDEPRMDNFAPPQMPGATPEGDSKEEGKKETAKADKSAKVEEVPDDGDDDEELDEEGLTPMHIDMVMQNAGCTRKQAVKALRETNNDMVNAIMHLTK